ERRRPAGQGDGRGLHPAAGAVQGARTAARAAQSGNLNREKAGQDQRRCTRSGRAVYAARPLTFCATKDSRVSCPTFSQEQLHIAAAATAAFFLSPKVACLGGGTRLACIRVLEHHARSWPLRARLGGKKTRSGRGFV